jgi:hypothetical protein
LLNLLRRPAGLIKKSDAAQAPHSVVTVSRQRLEPVCQDSAVALLIAEFRANSLEVNWQQGRTGSLLSIV